MIAAKPYVLIVDDDPVSLAYLRAVVERRGCTSIAAADARAALRVLHSNPVDLLLIDRRMPGTDGAALLQAVRARGIDAPAIATSAELDPATIAALHAAGFADTLGKPASLAAIDRLLQRFLSIDPLPGDEGIGALTRPSACILDDAAALTAIGGDREALHALRGLFACELDAVANEFVTAAFLESTTLGERLHRLRASCGLCGATALGAAVLRLERALREDGDAVGAARSEFLDLCVATQAALAHG